jgi:hypothetical protein
MSPEVVARGPRPKTLTLRSWLRLPRLPLPRLELFDPSWASRPLHAQCVVGSTPLLFVVLCDELRISALCHVFSSLTSTKTGITTNGGAFYSLMIPAYLVVLVVKMRVQRDQDTAARSQCMVRCQSDFARKIDIQPCLPFKECASHKSLVLAWILVVR